MLHDLDFGRGDAVFNRPTCRVCYRVVGRDQWVANEECPGPPKCDPIGIHYFLEGRMHCECRALSYGSLEDFWGQLPLVELGVSGKEGRDGEAV